MSTRNYCIAVGVLWALFLGTLFPWVGVFVALLFSVLVFIVNQNRGALVGRPVMANVGTIAAILTAVSIPAVIVVRHFQPFSPVIGNIVGPSWVGGVAIWMFCSISLALNVGLSGMKQN